MAASFLAWKRTLDKLKIDARAQTDEDPTPSEAASVLAEAAANTPLTEWMATVRATAQTGVDIGLKPAPFCTVYGWRLCLSRMRVPDDRYSWHLSASLSPRGRHADVRDWQMLGKIAAHLGAPRDPLVVPENPNDVHHWQWLNVDCRITMLPKQKC